MKDLSIKKLYYSISEVSKMTEVEQYVLRYWETEFEQLKPQKNRAGNRIYTNKDIQLVIHIKNLLRDKKYTIEGAKNILMNETFNKHGELMPPVRTETAEAAVPEQVEEPKKEKPSLKKDLEDMKNILEYLLSKL